VIIHIGDEENVTVTSAWSVTSSARTKYTIMSSIKRDVVGPEVEMSRDATSRRLTSESGGYTSFRVADILRPSTSLDDRKSGKVNSVINSVWLLRSLRRCRQSQSTADIFATTQRLNIMSQITINRPTLARWRCSRQIMTDFIYFLLADSAVNS